MLSPQFSLDLHREITVDLFAGGGGASTGIEQAIGRPVDVAINHDPEAISLHAANHPQTLHYTADVFEVDPHEATEGRPVGLLWASPSCTHFSRARGGVPVSKQLRSLGWVVVRWAAAVKPRVIVCENVAEWRDWGPVIASKGVPCPKRKGKTFRQWIGHLQRLGYRVDHRELRACDYGTPTIRKRLFLVARRDGRPVVWPEQTHNEHGTDGMKKWRAAAECIDWSIPAPSIFGRKKPLADATLRRIAKGVMRYVVDAAEPFIAPNSQHAEIDRSVLVAAFLAKHYTGVIGADLRDPMPTVTSVDHNSLVAALLCKYYGNDKDGVDIAGPLHTIPTKDRFGLVLVHLHGQPYYIADIGMRMLQPHELYRAQGFPTDYQIDRGADGKPMTKTAQVRMVGNSVCPPLAKAIVSANYHEMAVMEAA